MLQALRSKKVVLIIVAIVVLLVIFNISSKNQNAAPVAKASANTSEGTAPLAVLFNGAESSDPDKDVLTFAWDFGDGTSSAEVNPAKTFEKSGEYKVVLKVSDTKQHTTEATPITIKVSPAAVQGASAQNNPGSTLGTSTYTPSKPSKKKQPKQQVNVVNTVITKPAVTLNADKTTITTGQSVVLSWSATGTAPLCTASNAWSGSLAASGSQTVSPTATSTYALTCVNGAGSDTKSVVITVNPPVVPEPQINLIKNSSFVELDAEDFPLHWAVGGDGVNSPVFGYEDTGRTDSSSVSIVMSEYVDGDAEWIFEPVDIVGGGTYVFSDWYKSDVQTELLIDYTLDDGTHQYDDLLDPVAPASDWTELSRTLVAPANAVQVTIYHMIKADGTLQLDDYSLVEK